MCRPLLTMQLFVGLSFVVSLAVALRTPTTKTPTTAKDVQLLHDKLENVVKGLESEVAVLGHSKAAIAPELKTFVQELRATLVATVSPSEAQVPAAMEKLRLAQAGVMHLSDDLTARQSALKKEQNANTGSVLLGVLMAEQDKPMAKQLEELKKADFAKLDVSKALLAKHDDKTPLFRQVALYMDKHGGNATALGNTTKAARLASTLLYFEKRCDKLKEEIGKMEAVHKNRSDTLQASINSSHKKEQHSLQMLKKHADREYKKHNTMYHKQLKLMEDVVSSLQKGDMHALQNAEDALQSALRSMQSHTQNFLHLLQTGRRLEQSDCPYCVAQCIEKCHDNGDAYSSCLTSCADAGK